MPDKVDDLRGVASQPNLWDVVRLLVAVLAPPIAPNMAVFLRAFILNALHAHRVTGTPIPPAPLVSLIEALEEVQAGHDSHLLKPTGREDPGSPGQHPLEELCIDIAVGYRLAVEFRHLEDKTPIKTIQSAFGGPDLVAGGLAKGTIQKWVSERRARVEPLLGPTALNFLNLAGSVYSAQFSRKARASRGRRK